MNIKTWQEEAKEWPDHRRGLATNQMIWMQQEIDELRAAYEALQKELELEKMMSVGYIAQGDRLSAENAAQAKRIAELEETNGLLQTQVHCLEMVAALKNGE